MNIAVAWKDPLCQNVTQQPKHATLYATQKSIIRHGKILAGLPKNAKKMNAAKMQLNFCRISIKLVTSHQGCSSKEGKNIRGGVQRGI